MRLECIQQNYLTYFESVKTVQINEVWTAFWRVGKYSKAKYKKKTS